MPAGQIVTFYSYKGGVGRSFLLSNVATLLTQWGYRVLCIDWDLEAPGLHYYFRPHMEEPRSGLVEMVLNVRDQRPVDALEGITQVTFPDGTTMDLIAAGETSRSYVDKVQGIDWDSLYSDADFGNILEEWRKVWINSYDVILVDSRTGISDSGGICTSQLPHVLAYAFTANQQNLDGVLDVVARAARARNGLPYDRSRLLTLPLLSRFDMNEEYERAAEWRTKLKTELEPSYNAWVPEGPTTDRVIDNCTVPYSAYWSFGEELPVLSEDIRNPQLISYSIATIAALIARKLEDVPLFTESRDAYVDGAIRSGRRGGTYRYDVFISSTLSMMNEARELYRLLAEEGISAYLPQENIRPGDSWSEQLRGAIDTSQHLILLVHENMKSHQREESNYFLRQTLDDHSDRKVFPVIASWDARRSLPSIVQNVVAYSLSDESPAHIARMIKSQIMGGSSLENSAAFHQLGVAAENQGDLSAAERHYRNALGVDVRAGDRTGLAASHRQLGRLAQLRGDYTTAELHYRASLAALEELGNRTGIATTYHQLGTLAQLRGNYQQAEERYRASLAIDEELGDRAGISSNYHQLGIIAEERGDYEQAEERYRASLAIEEELGNRTGIAAGYHQLGTLAQERGDYEQAEERYRASLAIEEELGNRTGIAAGYHQLGTLAQERGDYEQAEERYRASLAIEEELGNRTGIAAGYHQLGTLAQERGDYEQAEEHYRASLAIEKELGNRAGIATSYGQLGVLRTEQQRPADGVVYTLQAWELEKATGRPTGNSLYWLGRQRERLGDDAFRSLLHELLPDEAAVSIMIATEPRGEPAAHSGSDPLDGPASAEQT
ncbi:tetratricopeptide repeat protein [Streptomyces sp. SID6648]|nr:tetratricopeptide repeat protein [Streptomyces sp. SID6648]